MTGWVTTPTRIYQRRMVMEDKKLLEMLKAIALGNAKEIAQGLSDDYEEPKLCARLEMAIDFCEKGIGTEEDWQLIIEQISL